VCEIASLVIFIFLLFNEGIGEGGFFKELSFEVKSFEVVRLIDLRLCKTAKRIVGAENLFAGYLLCNFAPRKIVDIEGGDALGISFGELAEGGVGGFFAFEKLMLKIGFLPGLDDRRNHRCRLSQRHWYRDAFLRVPAECS
jgi:hypothetical protein